MAPVRIGTVQAESVWLDLQGAVDKTIKIIEDAASKGVKVLGFPEVYIGGYLWYVVARHQMPFPSQVILYYDNSSDF